MAARGGGKAVMSAVKGGNPRFAADSSKSNAKAKAKAKVKDVMPSASSELGKFLNIPVSARSETSKLISKFIKLNNRQNPGMKQDVLGEEKLKSILAGKEQVGIPEIAKLLSGQFVKTGKSGTYGRHGNR